MKMAWLSGKGWEKIETYIMVTAITALVWLYAEAETVKLQPMSIEVAFSTPSTHFIQSPKVPPRISVRFRCTSGQLENIQSLKDRGPLKIELAPEHERNQTIEVDMRSRLSRLPEIKQLAVSVESTTPEKIAVVVEGLVMREQVPIKVDSGNAALSDQKVEPPTVTLNMPATIAAELPDGTALTARLDEKYLNALEPGPHEITNVVLILPPVLMTKRVRVEPTRVKVTFRITKQTKELNKIVPLMVSISPSDMAEYVVAAERTVSILLIGPPGTMDQIESGQLREEVYAVLRVPREKLEQAAATGDETDHQATFHLPPGVRASPSQQLVTFKVDRRAAVEEDAE